MQHMLNILTYIYTLSIFMEQNVMFHSMHALYHVQLGQIYRAAQIFNTL